MPEYEKYRERFKKLQQDIRHREEEAREQARAKEEAQKEREKQERERLLLLKEFHRVAKPTLLGFLKDFNARVLSNRGLVRSWDTATKTCWEEVTADHDDPHGVGYVATVGYYPLREQYSFSCLELANKNRAILVYFLEKQGRGEFVGSTWAEVKETRVEGFVKDLYDVITRKRRARTVPLIPVIPRIEPLVADILGIAHCDIAALRVPSSWERPSSVGIDPFDTMDSFLEKVLEEVYERVDGIFRGFY